VFFQNSPLYTWPFLQHTHVGQQEALISKCTKMANPHHCSYAAEMLYAVGLNNFPQLLEKIMMHLNSF